LSGPFIEKYFVLQDKKKTGFFKRERMIYLVFIFYDGFCQGIANFAFLIIESNYLLCMTIKGISNVGSAHPSQMCTKR